jgi:MFS transporter, ACS family, solute carrier family 17 (sodium-dependent inorganic phosphate cotransporter), member 5
MSGLYDDPKQSKRTSKHHNEIKGTIYFLQGVSFPSIHTMLSLWAPPLERTKLSTIVYTGTHMGTVGALVLSGILIEKWGWESVFYFFGTLSCVWFFFWFFLAFDSPDSHPRISQAERIYINTAIGRPRISDDGAAAVSIPWRSMLTSVPVWAIFAGHIGFTWGLYTLLTNLPTFFSKVLHFRLKENGVMSALPYIALVVVMPIAGFAADALRSHNVLSTTSVRRLFQFAGSIIPAACLIAVGYVGCNVYAAVAVMIVAVASIGLAESGYQVNYLDLSPTYCGILMGLGNTLATIPGIVSK